MASFVNEQVKRLDASLDSSFETLQKSIVTLTSDNKHDQVLLETVQSLSLSSASLPSFDKIKECLDKYSTIDGPIDPTIEWLFIAKCTVAVYGQVFDNILNLTLPVSQSIDYWNHIHRNSLKEFYYALQIAPSRIYSLCKTTCNQISEKKLDVSVFASNDYILKTLFPIHQFKTSSFHWSKLLCLSSYSKRPLLLQLVRDEIDTKKKQLMQFRYHQASNLGILLQTSPRYQCDDGSVFVNQIAEETNKCIETLKYVLSNEQPSKDMPNLVSHLRRSSKEQHSHHLVNELRQLVSSWSDVHSPQLNSVHVMYGTPSALTRYWIPSLISYFTLKWSIDYGLKRKADIIKATEELGQTLHDFILNWVWQPVLRVWDTIRLKDERLSILSKEALQSDLNSLERMVTGFAKDNLHLPDNELSMLAYKVREGDMSIVLKEYEREIKNPLKNAITGDLLQTMLIQVQKTKVDVDIAMSALDKLLKSNELNFAFLAVAPSMLLTWASVSWLKTRIQGRSKQRMQKTGRPLRDTVRRIERQLIINEPIQELSEWGRMAKNDNDRSNCEVQGILLCEVHLLRAYAGSLLPSKNSMRARFMEDIRDLENPSLSNNQKIQTIARMSRFWSFL